MIDNADSAATAGLSAVTMTLAAATASATCMFTDNLIDARKTGDTTYDLTRAMN